MIWGDRRPHLVALLVSNPEWAKSWAEVAGKPGDLAMLRNDPEFLKALGVAMDDVNHSLPVVERIRRFAGKRELSPTW
jgi:long-chain acyl-CoA synthetase